LYGAISRTQKQKFSYAVAASHPVAFVFTARCHDGSLERRGCALRHLNGVSPREHGWRLSKTKAILPTVTAFGRDW
jgi:hypothetical protein